MVQQIATFILGKNHGMNKITAIKCNDLVAFEIAALKMGTRCVTNRSQLLS